VRQQIPCAETSVSINRESRRLALSVSERSETMAAERSGGAFIAMRHGAGVSDCSRGIGTRYQ
jgi:hypothetical protein